MKLYASLISPEKIEFTLLAEGVGEIALIKFCENQVLKVNVSRDWEDRLVLSGVIQV